MSALPVEYDPRAVDDLRAVPPPLRPAVLEHLSRLASDHASCSRPTSFPRPPGRESGLWMRHGAGATLLEVLFRLDVQPDRILVRRALLTSLERLPDWVLRPDEWAAHPPWPVVDV